MNLLQGVVLALESVVQIVGIRAGVEQPRHQTLMREGALELREYPARLVAETTVGGQAETARNDGFRRVAGYIFGDNQRSEQVSMTSPVVQQRGQTISMTAPVVQTPDPAGSWKIQFVMPSKYARIEDLPWPTDPSVKLRQEPPAKYAVLRFSGSRAGKAVAAQSQRLLTEVAAHGWKARGEPVAWFYDPPWTLPMARRNEVAVRVD